MSDLDVVKPITLSVSKDALKVSQVQDRSANIG